MIVITILLFIVAMSLPSFLNSISSVSLLRISTLSFIYAGALAFNALYIQEIGSGIGIYSGFFQITSFSQYIDIFILVIASLCIVGIIRPIYVKNLVLYTVNNNKYNYYTPTTKYNILVLNSSNENIIPKYLLIVLFSTLGSLMLVSSSDLISMYLSIELQSFGVYILATLHRDSALATSAGLKYFLLGGLSSCLILLGAGLLYSYTGLTNFESIYSLCGVTMYGNSSSLISQGILLGFSIIFVGFLFKIAAAPLHHWAPDVYDDSPTLVTIWLTIMPKIAILLFLLELASGLLGNISFISNSISETQTFELSETIQYMLNISGLDLMTQGLQNLLLLSSLLSLIIGTIVGLAQTRIKRLLAYSTISHIGFMLLALCINTEQSIESFIFYIIQYTLTNLNVFLIIIAFSYLMYQTHMKNKYTLIQPHQEKEVSNQEKTIDLSSLNNHIINSIIIEEDINRDIRFISELKGQFYSNPLLSISFAICLFSMAGIPPLLGFFSKQMVLYTAIQSGYYFMSIVAIIVSVISASYYLKIINTLFSEKLNNEHYNTISKDNSVEPNSSSTPGLKDQVICTNTHSFLISILTLTILLYILNPSILLNSTQLLALTLFTTI